MDNTEKQSQLDNRFPVSRLFSSNYFDQYQSDFSPGKPVYHITETDYATLDDVASNLESEMSFMACGVQGIGNLLSIATENKKVGISDNTLLMIGWCLGHLGAELNEQTSLIIRVKEILAHCQVQPSGAAE